MADMTPEDMQKLATAFGALQLKPKADTPEDLVKWMTDFAATQQPNVKTEPGSGAPGSLVIQRPPRLPTFSGDRKGDVTFDLWRYEVKCLLAEHHPIPAIQQAIRWSLRGEAGRIVMRMGPNTDIQQLLDKLDSVYGAVTPKELLLADFFSAKQQPEEDVSSWGCRLEDLLAKAVEQGQIDFASSEKMLRSLFWSGLRQPLKDVSGHLFEQLHDFDQLRVRIRQLEQDRTPPTVEKPKPTPAKSATENKEFTELKTIVKQLAADVKSMKDSQPPSGNQYPSQRQPSLQGDQRNSQHYNPPQHQPSWQGEQRNSQHYNPPPPTQPMQQQPEEVEREPEDFICWRCGQSGHIALGCRVRLDHQRKPLNSKWPASRGRR